MSDPYIDWLDAHRIALEQRATRLTDAYMRLDAEREELARARVTLTASRDMYEEWKAGSEGRQQPQPVPSDWVLVPPETPGAQPEGDGLELPGFLDRRPSSERGPEHG
jgi:hypothetical protein